MTPTYSIQKETALRQTEHVPTTNTASHGKAGDLNFEIHENESPEKASDKMGTIQEETSLHTSVKGSSEGCDSDTAYFNNEVNDRDEEQI